MEKTLGTIQKLYKAGQILSMIIFVCCIVGAVFSLIGVICAAIGTAGSLSFLGTNLKGIIGQAEGQTQAQLLQALIEGTVTSAAEIPLAWFARKYFENEQKVGHPFTLEGAKELKRLGILAIAIPIGAQFVSGIINGIITVVTKDTWTGNINQGSSVVIGIMFLLMSLIYRYVAEKEQQGETKPAEAGQN